MKKTESTEAAPQSRKVGLARRASWDMAMAQGLKRMALGLRPQGVAEAWGDEEELADADEEEEAAEAARHIRMGETETATRTATDSESATETGALATND